MAEESNQISTWPEDHKPPRKTAADILALDDTKTDEVFVEEWDTNVKVKGLTKRQQIEIRERSLVDGVADAEKSQLGMWKEGVIEPVFDDAQLPLLFEKNAGAVDKVLARVLELSGMKPGGVAAKEARFPSGQ